MTVTARAVQFISYNRTGYVRLRFLIDFGQVAHLTFSLLINISATSIIAFKTWCARSDRALRKHFVDCLDPCRKYRKLLMEGGIGVQTPTQTTRILALLVESGMIYILIGVSSALEFKHGLSRFLFSLKVTSVTSIIISLRFGLKDISAIFTLVSIQLTVRNSFREATLELY
jgi:hypothetical protein